MAVAPDDWRLIAQGDSTEVPSVEVPAGVPWAVVLDFPVRIPDWLAPTLATALAVGMAPFGTVERVDVAGNQAVIAMAPG